LLDQGPETRKNNRSNKKGQVIIGGIAAEIHFEMVLNDCPERPQHDHVNNQVFPVGMNKGMRQKPVELLAVVYFEGIKLKLFNHLLVVKSQYGSQGYYQDQH